MPDPLCARDSATGFTALRLQRRIRRKPKQIIEYKPTIAGLVEQMAVDEGRERFASKAKTLKTRERRSRSMSKAKVILGAFLAVLSLSALMASSASAGWLINGTLLSGTAALATTAEVTEHGQLKFSETTIECSGASLDGTKPEIEETNKIRAASLTFLKCETITGSNCTLTGQPLSIGTQPVEGEVTLEGTLGAFAILKAKTKTIFATIKLEGGSCSLAGVDAVTGQAKISGPTGQMSKVGQEIVANTASGELKVGTASATLKGKAILQLASELPWSFD